MKTLYIFTILLFLLYIAGSCNDDQQKLFSREYYDAFCFI